MTTIQLAQRLMLRGQLRDLSILPFTDLTTLLDAMNSAVSEYFDLAPDIYSQTTISTILPAPLTTTVDAITGDNVFAADVFLAEQRGATVRIGDDPAMNEVETPNSILDAYRGTSGQQTGIIYGDSVAFLASDFKRLAGDPRLDNGIELVRNEALRDRRFRGSRGTGTPRYYYSEPVGQSQGGKEAVILRVDPMPSREFTIRAEAIILPILFTYEDFTTPRDIPIPDQMILRGLMPLCFAYLRGSVFWAGDKNTDADATKARAVVSDLPAHLARPRSRTLTRRGW